MKRAAIIAAVLLFFGAIAAVLLGAPPPTTRYSSGTVPASPGPGRCSFKENVFSCTGRAAGVVTTADGTKLMVRAPFSVRFGIEP